VLVARKGGRGRPILAATDLQDPTFPVLKDAAQLALTLEHPLITFHNVDPLSMMSGKAALSTGVVLRGGVSAATRRESLVGVSRALKVEPTPIIRTELDAVHAILDEANVCDAGLIVVGTRPCSWWQRLVDDGVATRVGNRADRDVLVTPIGASRHA
jgi:nucleotide-binding universal stress UspA family protein